MTSPEASPITALCDRLEQLAAPGACLPWTLHEDQFDDEQADINDSRGLGVLTDLGIADAALIVAAVNALPELIAELRRQAAALHAVLAFANGWDAVADTWRETADASSTANLRDQAIAEAAWYRERAASLRTALAAAAGQ